MKDTAPVALRVRLRLRAPEMQQRCVCTNAPKSHTQGTSPARLSACPQRLPVRQRHPRHSTRRSWNAAWTRIEVAPHRYWNQRGRQTHPAQPLQRGYRARTPRRRLSQGTCLAIGRACLASRRPGRGSSTREAVPPPTPAPTDIWCVRVRLRHVRVSLGLFVRVSLCHCCARSTPRVGSCAERSGGEMGLRQGNEMSCAGGGRRRGVQGRGPSRCFLAPCNP
mmetsp:Transcript_36407/g.115954  ORF Transcript_36407/g.115954 Transcript_36407/m.115954 type:complete len:222 (+) Transcript_36407:1734-2399(+)